MYEKEKMKIQLKIKEEKVKKDCEMRSEIIVMERTCGNISTSLGERRKKEKT